MKKLIIAFAALIVLVVVFGCADDIILPKDPPLNGVYKGTYTVTQDYGAAAESTLTNFVIWRFTDTKYFMKLDTARHTGVCFCRVEGRYSLTDGVRLKESSWQVDGRAEGCTACNESSNPDGTFQRQIQDNVLILRTLDNATNTFLELELTPTDEPWEEVN
jgi:hypothetical protein